LSKKAFYKKILCVDCTAICKSKKTERFSISHTKHKHLIVPTAYKATELMKRLLKYCNYCYECL